MVTCFGWQVTLWFHMAGDALQLWDVFSMKSYIVLFNHNNGCVYSKWCWQRWPHSGSDHIWHCRLNVFKEFKVSSSSMFWAGSSDRTTGRHSATQVRHSCVLNHYWRIKNWGAEGLGCREGCPLPCCWGNGLASRAFNNGIPNTGILA